VCIPWQEVIILETDILKIIGILKITRLPKLAKIINRLDMKDVVKAYFAIFVMAIYLFVYIHVTTCIFFYLMSLDKSWIPFKDQPKKLTDVFERNQAYQYFTCMYYMVLVVGGNDTCPSNVLLKYYSALAILVGNLYMANIMGSLVDYGSVISRRDNAF
jgi:hypothetical protein